MAANARFESAASASSSEPGFSGPYTNGKRGNAGASLDRSGSFREGTESRIFGTGFAVTRSGSSAAAALGTGTGTGGLPPLAQCLSLEPIQIGDRKIDRSVELKRVMGLIVGTGNDDGSSGVTVAAHSKPSSPLAVAEDLKRLRSSVVDTCNTARGRASKLDEHLHKLDKYCDGVNTKKTQRSELLTNDQAGSLNSKIGTQIYRNPTELVNQRIEDRPKNVLLNKRVRTSVAETRPELRSNGLRKQTVVMAKERDTVKDNNVGESDILEEKIQRLPVGGEGWDKKMKRKRSVGMVSTRPMDNNGETKRIIQNKVVSEPLTQSNDTHPFRLGASNGNGNTHKSDNKSEGSSFSNGSRARMSPRNELEGPTRDTGGSNKEKIIVKGNNKLNSRDDNYIPSGNLVTKGKATRNSRNGAMMAASSTPSTPRLSGTPESWENLTDGGKLPSTGGAVNRKRAMPVGPGPSSPNMAQWVGQRPQKMSRTRRSNLVSPVSNQEEKPLSSDSCSHSDVSVRLASDATNGPVVSKLLKPKPEPVQSPYRVSESEESIGGQTGGCQTVGGQIVGGQTVGPSLAVGMKAKSVNNEESGDGVKKQSRSGRGPLIAKASSSVTGDKLDNNTPMVKPIRSNKPGPEKNGSKSGRPLKKLSDRKGFSRLGNLQNGGSECSGSGKSDDDREELLAAANYARNASYLACSSAFWKKFEPIFAPISSKDKTYLSTQLKEPDFQESFPQFHGRPNNVSMSVTHEVSVYGTNGSGERNMHVKHQGSESFSGRLDSDKSSKESIPLIHRVLSALIMEDTVDELEEEENIPLQDTFCDSAYDTFQHDDFSEPRKRPRREVEQDTMFQSIHSVKLSFSSNGCATNTFRSPTVNDSPCDDMALAGVSKNLVNRPQVVHVEGFSIHSYDNQYEQMRMEDKILLELHSIGLYPDLVPKLDDKEDEAIKQEINQLKTKLRQQNYKKKAYLEKICRSIGSPFVGRDLEQLALDRLVELAYRKLLATKGPSRGGTPKIPKHVALAFGRRALARCRKFGKSGASCFSVAPLRDILFAPPDIELEPPANTNTKYIGFQNPHQDSRITSDEAFAINGPISNRGKKKQLLLDDVGTAYGGNTGKRAYQGERKIKATTKQKAGQIPPTPGTRTLHPVQPSLIRESRMVIHATGPQDSMENMDPLNELDPVDELGVGGPQDLSSLLNFDDEELQDHFSAGLDIPMDDLTELNMF